MEIPNNMSPPFNRWLLRKLDFCWVFGWFNYTKLCGISTLLGTNYLTYPRIQPRRPLLMVIFAAIFSILWDM